MYKVGLELFNGSITTLAVDRFNNTTDTSGIMRGLFNGNETDVTSAKREIFHLLSKQTIHILR